MPMLPAKKQGNQSEISQQINRMSKVVEGMLHDKNREKMKRKIKQHTEQLYAEIPRKRVPLKMKPLGVEAPSQPESKALISIQESTLEEPVQIAYKY